MRGNRPVVFFGSSGVFWVGTGGRVNVYGAFAFEGGAVVDGSDYLSMGGSEDL